MTAAKELARDPVDVTLIDRNNFHTFQPLLYQVATAGLNAADVAYPIRGIFQQPEEPAFRQGDGHRRRLGRATRSPSTDGAPLPFDYLVVAAGASTNTFGVAGRRRPRLPALQPRATPSASATTCSAGSRPPTPTRRSSTTARSTSWSSAAAPTGVEVAGALVELFAQVLRKDFRDLDVAPGPGVPARDARRAAAALQRRRRSATPARPSSGAASTSAPARRSSASPRPGSPRRAAR